MPKLSYVVNLSDTERVKSLKITNNGTAAAKRILHASILLALDENNPNKAGVPLIGERFHVHSQTIQTIRKSYATRGLEAALDRKQRSKPPIEPELACDVEARIIALCCNKPPAGFQRWTLRLAAEEAIKLEIVESICHMSVGRILKKRT